MTFIWRDSYFIDHAEIDAEHQQLFRLVNDFFEASEKIRKTECATRLLQYTCEHFRHEEMLMQDIGYPAMPAHVEQHHLLIGRLHEAVDKVEKDTLNASELQKFLTAWLVGHIVTFDTKLSSYVHRKQEVPADLGA